MFRSALKALLPLILLSTLHQAHAQDSLDLAKQLTMLERFEACGLPMWDAELAASVFKKANTLLIKGSEAKKANTALEKHMKGYKPSEPSEACAEELMEAGSNVQFLGFFNAEVAGDVRLVPFGSRLDKESTRLDLLFQTLDPLSKVHACISDAKQTQALTDPIYFRAKSFLAKDTGRPYRDGGPVDNMFARRNQEANKIPMSPSCTSGFFEAGAKAYLLTRLLMVDELADRAVAITRRYVEGAKR